MFGIGWTEILIVLVVALLVLGPKRLPEIAKGLGRGLRDFRKAMSGLDLDDPPDRGPRAPNPPPVEPPARPAPPPALHAAPPEAPPAEPATPATDSPAPVDPLETGR